MYRVTMDHLRVTIGHPKVTLGHPRVTIGHLRVIMGHLRLTIGYLEANTTELHPKVRQTCFNIDTYIYSLSTIYLPSILITVFFPWLIVLRKIEILLSTLDKLLTQY